MHKTIARSAGEEDSGKERERESVRVGGGVGKQLKEGGKMRSREKKWTSMKGEKWNERSFVGDSLPTPTRNVT